MITFLRYFITCSHGVTLNLSKQFHIIILQKHSWHMRFLDNTYWNLLLCLRHVSHFTYSTSLLCHSMRYPFVTRAGYLLCNRHFLSVNSFEVFHKTEWDVPNHKLLSVSVVRALICNKHWNTELVSLPHWKCNHFCRK